MEKVKILVVDDDPNLSRLVKICLEKTQLYQVQEENRSARVLATVREFKPDALLLDVDMPGKDGGELARDVKADPSLKGLRIMFFTSLVSGAEAGQREVYRNGVPFLAKPLNPMALIGAVERLLASGGAAA